jgi:hypothetical protein
MKNQYWLFKNRYPLRTPTVGNKKTEGWLLVRRWKLKGNYTVKWDFGSIDWLAVDESYLFPQLLEAHPWQHEFLQRLKIRKSAWPV